LPQRHRPSDRRPDHRRRNPSAASSPPPPPRTDYYASNVGFFDAIPPDSDKLDHVHGQALDSIPAASLPLVDAVLSSFLAAALRHPNDDSPVTAIYALPRLLLAPPPAGAQRRNLPAIIRDRVASLALGGAADAIPQCLPGPLTPRHKGTVYWR
jgi:hypothetical protein